jgi:hypothetical protein
MIDSGCEGHGYIDSDFARDNNLPLFPLKRSFELRGFDGDREDPRFVRYFTRCTFRSGDHIEKDAFFYVTALAHYPIILGTSWLQKHDPKTSWSGWTITFDSKYCQDRCGISQYPSRQHLLRDVPSQKDSAPAQKGDPDVRGGGPDAQRPTLYRYCRGLPERVPEVYGTREL